MWIDLLLNSIIIIIVQIFIIIFLYLILIGAILIDEIYKNLFVQYSLTAIFLKDFNFLHSALDFSILLIKNEVLLFLVRLFHFCMKNSPKLSQPFFHPQ